MDKILTPKTVVLIGVSHNVTKVGYQIFSNLQSFKGKIFGVNNKGGKILGHNMYKSVLDIEEKIDLAIISIPASKVINVLKECGKKLIRSCVVISAGFKEIGETNLEKKLVEISKQLNIRIIGPNCLGIINTHINLNASFAEYSLKKGNIALISQSGAMAVAITDWAYKTSMGFSKIISLGNKSDLDECDFIEILSKDKNTKIILLYLEDIKDGKNFIETVSKTRKPIIAIKSGSSIEGSNAIKSHTGSLSGSNTSIDVVFKKTGIIKANTIEDFFDYAEVFSMQNLPNSNRVAIITNAGGPGIMAVDAMNGTNLRLSKLSEQTICSLKDKLPGSVSLLNPIDIVGDALSDRYEIAIREVIRDSNVDILLILLTPQIMTEKEKTANKIIELSKQYDKTIITSFIGGKNIEYAVNKLNENNIPNLLPERSIKALNKMVIHKKFLGKTIEHRYKNRSNKNLISINRCIKDQGFTYDTIKKIMSYYGISFPRIELAYNLDDALRIANSIGYPVVLKISTDKVIHKTEIGGVITDIKTQAELKKAYLRIIDKVDIKINGILVQKMENIGKEVIIGMKRDPQFGPIIMFGLGGIYVELLKDVSFRLAPVSKEESLEMINEIKSINLLKGVRGENPSDIDKISETIVSISKLSLELPSIKELDINPLIVYEQGKGVKAIDIRIVT